VSEEVVGESFEVARRRLEEAFKAAVSNAKSSVEAAKSEALRRLEP